MKQKVLSVLAGISMLGGTVAAQNTDAVMSNGGGYTYTLNTPARWVAADDIAKQQEVNAVWIPENKSWETSGTIIYTNVSSLNQANNESMYDVIDFDINMYRLSSPKINITDGTPIAIDKGRGTATVIVIKSTEENTFEAIAYMDEEAVVPFVVMISKSEDDFYRDYPVFKEIVASYRFYDNVQVMNAKK